MRHYVAAVLAALTLTACQDATPRASVTEPPQEPVVVETTTAAPEVTTPAPTPVRVVTVPSPKPSTKPPAPKPTPAPVRTTTRPPAPPPPPTTDPRFGTCKEAKAHGYGPYTRGVDPEYYWYRDADHDGVDCE